MALIDLLFPRRCLGCGKYGSYFCQDCLKTIKPIERQVCPVCEKPAINGLTHPRCQTRSSLDGLVSLFSYEGMIRKAIAKLKYKFVTDLASELIIKMIQIIETDRNGRFKYLNCLMEKKEQVILVPVPLHSRRERWRGFNQAELLGKILVTHFGWQFVPDFLFRQKSTKPQVGLKSDKRQQNIHGAFKISPNIQISQYPNIVIFDDVWTTGSTLNEAGKVLKMAGTKKVWGLTLAR
jgi:ComF family protein